jgi:hypothetical protein
VGDLIEWFAILPDGWDRLSLLVNSPEQEAYDLLRPIVLFGQLVPASETAVPERTLAPQGLPIRGAGRA